MVKEVNMDTSSTIKRLLGECENIRTENQREGQRREREIRQGFPAIAALLDERRDRLTGSIRAALQGCAVNAENLQGEMRELNGRIRAELTKAGYPEDYLQPIYRCPICRDTGYVGEPVHELCACMKQRIMDAENAGEHKGGLGRRSVAQLRRILRAAQRYAEDFPDNEKPTLIFFGAAGLGKTFVADCIAQRIMERAYLVRRVTAYRLCEIMRKNQFDGSEARAVEGVMDCDLLFIDALGTEPQTKNTSGYLFQVMNERNMNERRTIIRTNLNPERMEGMYEQRVASRLMDVSRTTAIRFYGEDLRLRK